MVQPIPDGFHTVTPHLTVKNAAEMIDFYSRAFGAVEMHRQAVEGSDLLMHATIRIGNSMVMLNDEFPDHGALAPEKGKAGMTINLYVEDIDALFKQAVDAGAEVMMPPTDMFWGDRYAMLFDPSGHRWSIATHKEDPTPEEITERAKKAFD